MNKNVSINTITILSLVGLSVLTLLVYYPGLHGPFLLDDYINLQDIGKNGGLDSFENWWQFVTSGESGPLGRPLSLASFTLNTLEWPAAPFPFKATNLVLHIINGFLVFFLTTKILYLLGYTDSRKKILLSVAVTAYWLIMPVQTTSVLYVVQRMTILSATFTLMGLFFYTRMLQTTQLDGFVPYSTPQSYS